MRENVETKRVCIQQAENKVRQLKKAEREMYELKNWDMVQAIQSGRVETKSKQQQQASRQAGRQQTTNSPDNVSKEGRKIAKGKKKEIRGVR